MALFKIFKGNQTEKLINPSANGYRQPTDGYAYYDTSTKKFYIDADYNNNGIITRSPINADKAFSIPFGEVDKNASTATAFVANIPGITELHDGVCIYLKNGVVTSAANCTLNINQLGAKPIYQTMAKQGRITTTFNENYTMLFIYNSTRVIGGCWDMYYGYNSNTDTKVRQTLKTDNINRPLLMSYSKNDVTTANVDNISYRNNNIYGNASTGIIGATQIKLTRDPEEKFEVATKQYVDASSASNVYTAGGGIDITQNEISNDGVRTIAASSTKPGTLVVNIAGTISDITIPGLGENAIDSNLLNSINYYIVEESYNEYKLYDNNKNLVSQNTLNNILQKYYMIKFLLVDENFEKNLSKLNYSAYEYYYSCYDSSKNNLIISGLFVKDLQNQDDSYLQIFTFNYNEDEDYYYTDRSESLKIPYDLNNFVQNEISSYMAGQDFLGTQALVTTIENNKIYLRNLNNNNNNLSAQNVLWTLLFNLVYFVDGSTGASLNFQIMGINLNDMNFTTLVLFGFDYATNQAYEIVFTDNSNEDCLIGFKRQIPISRFANDINYAQINSPSFTGEPTAPTPDASSNNTSIATTAFVKNATKWENITNKPTPSEAREQLGLSNAMHFIGIATVDIEDGSTINPTINNYDFSKAQPGDVIIDKNNTYEYVWSGTAWEILGPDNSYKVLQQTVTDPIANGEASAFISSITQNANGVISVTKANLPTNITANLNGNATSANKVNHTLFFGSNKVFSYDGSEDVTVPTYTGDIVG